MSRDMKNYKLVALREHAELRNSAAVWFHEHWDVPAEAYLESMDACIAGKNAVPQWYLAMDGEKFAAGAGVIENDFHSRKDLTPNVCALYVEEEFRHQGLAGRLLRFIEEDMCRKGISTLYLVTDHTAFYEQYGWKFLCTVQCDGEQKPSRMYVHREETVVRAYRPDDCRELVELFYNTVHTVNARDYSEEQLNAWATGAVNLEEWNRTLSEHHSFVAVKDGTIVGFGDIDRSGYLDRLYVHRDYQGQGVGTAVCNRLEQAVQGEITVHASITARPFFESRGYTLIREQQVKRRGILLVNYVMRKYR